jgi:hypothetical protein
MAEFTFPKPVVPDALRAEKMMKMMRDLFGPTQPAADPLIRERLKLLAALAGAGIDADAVADACPIWDQSHNRPPVPADIRKLALKIEALRRERGEDRTQWGNVAGRDLTEAEIAIEYYGVEPQVFALNRERKAAEGDQALIERVRRRVADFATHMQDFVEVLAPLITEAEELATNEPTKRRLNRLATIRRERERLKKSLCEAIDDHRRDLDEIIPRSISSGDVRATLMIDRRLRKKRTPTMMPRKKLGRPPAIRRAVIEAMQAAIDSGDITPTALEARPMKTLVHEFHAHHETIGLALKEVLSEKKAAPSEPSD